MVLMTGKEAGTRKTGQKTYVRLADCVECVNAPMSCLADLHDFAKRATPNDFEELK